MCILFLSMKTTNLTLCGAVVRKSTRSVREYGFPFSKWSFVPNHGWCFWLLTKLKGSTTFTNRCTGCEKIVLATHIPNELPILPYLLECFVSAQIIILQSSAWLFKNCKTWANAWSKLPGHIDTLEFVHAQYWGLKELSLHSPYVHLHKKSELQIFHL